MRPKEREGMNLEVISNSIVLIDDDQQGEEN
jgi:hypothetical protein